MSSLGMVLDIATSALAAQQHAIDVTAHNIANVDTEGYSRQIPSLQAKQAVLHQGMILGRGVEIEQVARSIDQFIENKLMQEKSNLSSFQEMEKYMQVLEAMFSESSDASMSATLSDFWNLWHDISNNPSGSSERIALYEHSLLMSEQFQSLIPDLNQIQTDITNAITVGIERINQITSEISQINVEIVGMEANNNVANDLRDKRNALVSELNEYLDIKTFEQSSHSLTIVAAKGCTLVHNDRNYELEIYGDRVKWQDSGGNYVDITNHISNGKIGGWLELRDEIIAKYELDLDAMAKEFIWSVNQQHSQGVGLKLFESGSTITGDYQTNTDLGELEYGSEIQFIANGFNLWIEDRTDPANPTIDYVSVDLSSLNSSSSLSDLATAINNQITGVGLTGITVDGSGSALSLIAGNNYAFGFSDDNSNILAALGVNTFFTGTGAGSIGLNAMLNDKDYIAAAQIDSDGSYAAGDNTNALAMTDLQYTSMDISQWTCDRINGNTEGSVTTTIEDYYHSMVGSIGIISSSISRDTKFNEMMVKELNTLRDSISAVSLDEEMANLIKYQHAYQAAAKLITISDEMLETLISTR
ncbi:MAG: flagellar hook-associated protein FlgK [Desulfobacteraceae bacterium 4572_187]|nr:MAG: flagellar hook-associated protein FlgK [Desulfobacteraceae bacterium 4572_187]